MAAAHPAPSRAPAFCHSLTLSWSRPPETGELRRSLARALPATAGVSLWESRAPVVASHPTASAYAEREAARPLREAGQLLRVVLVRYTDGPAALVLVADRAALSRAGLDRVTAGLTGGADGPVELANAAHHRWDSATAQPAWGLGDVGRRGALGSIPFEVPVPPQPLDLDLLTRAAAVVLAHYDAGETPRIGVLDPQGPNGDRTMSPGEDLGAAPLDGTDPLPPVGIVLTDAEPDRRYRPCLAPAFPVTLYVERRADGSARGTCWYDPALIGDAVADTFARSVARAVVEVAGQGEPVAVEPTSPQEAAALVALGSTPAPSEGSEDDGPAVIHHRLRNVARRRPDAVALEDGRTTLTYRALEETAAGTALALRALGLRPGQAVGVCLERDATLVVTLLAVLQAGCAYVPLDPRYPAERLRHTTQDAGIGLVVTDSPVFPDVNGVKTVSPQELSRLARTAPANDLPLPTQDAAAGAYVIYTSGTSGRPKGVMVPHRNVVALVEGASAGLALGADDVWTLFHSSAFDFSVWEIWGCLLTGGRLVVVPHWVTRDTAEFHELLADRRVTVLSQTPSAFGRLIETDLTAGRELALRLVVFGGEPLDTRMLLPWFARHAPAACRLVNMFGITETTVHVTAETVTPEAALRGSRSVGRALPGWSVSVRDPRGRVLPPGAAGEIYVGGAGVADGYLGRPDLTAERFVTDAVTGGRVYRSGDLGRMRPDGSIDHLGRLDSQVKLRGYRIELDEIRNVLLGVPCVSAAAVVLNPGEDGDPASARIDAYAVLTGGSVAEALAGARSVLPEHMVPTTLTALASIPLTLNGKLDTALLPSPRFARDNGIPRRSTSPGPAGAQDLLESELLALLGRHLGTEVRVDDNFFELGGNSLLVVRVLADLRELGLPRISTRDFYGNSTAGQFIEFVRGLRD
ncbi:amino acid adenylation domain-containing protein [Streptomyces sp. SID6648]|nr:amino acid adenylation domain-containing protein [Streptomyces sp. SID6648]